MNEQTLEDDLRACDTCGWITDAGDYPDWPNGECERCDPQGCICGQEETYPFIHADECPMSEENKKEAETN